MAAKVAGSSSASADSCAGELISVTSISEIRYEGHLHDMSFEKFTICLRNVRSFGTEGRRKDGPQVPPGDRIYEYILFRGSNIKDFKIIPSPSVYDDPAIVIQSQNSQVTTSLASTSAGPRFIPNHSSPSQYTGHHFPTFQGNVPLHQSAGSLGSCVTSSPPSTDHNGLRTSRCWPGFHGCQNSFQPHQQAMPQHPLGLSMLSTHSMMQYPQLNGLLTGNSVLQPPQLLESSSCSLASNKCGYMHFHSTVPRAPPSALVPQLSTRLVPAMSSAQSLPTVKFGTAASPYLVSPLTNNSISELSFPLPVSDKSKLASTSYLASSSTSESLSLAVERSSVLPKDHRNPSLVTPSQLFQTELSSVSPSVALPKPPSTMVNEISSLDSEAPMFAAQKPSETSYTEEFDFMAMNEKFKKDEIWGGLNNGRNRDKSLEDKNKKVQPSYVKGSFFDSLSTQRSRISEHKKEVNDTFDKALGLKVGRGGGPTSAGQSLVRSRVTSHELGVKGRGRGLDYGTLN